MKYYYEKAILLNDHSAVCNLAFHYQYVEFNYEKMLQLYILALTIDNKDSESMYCLANYYKKIKDYKNSIYYYKLSLVNSNKRSDQIIFKFNKLDQYLLLENNIFVKNNKYITDLSKNIINNYDIVKKYKNKCNILIKKETCILCLKENVDCIPLDCAHYLCINANDNDNNINCYSIVTYNKKCPICSSTILFIQ